MACKGERGVWVSRGMTYRTYNLCLVGRSRLEPLSALCDVGRNVGADDARRHHVQSPGLEAVKSVYRGCYTAEHRLYQMIGMLDGLRAHSTP